MKNKTFYLKGTPVYLETGRIAGQADGAVLVRQGDAVVLVTVVSDAKPREGLDFFPLTVDYRELFGAAGRIPHAYGRREGRLSDREILTCRIIDRSIRPLFPKSYRCETQVIATVMSSDPDVDTDVLGLFGATAAIYLSGIPWQGPASGVRIIRSNGEFLINPSRSDRQNADLDLIITAGQDGLIMLEGRGDEAPEKLVIKAIELAQDEIQNVLESLISWREQLNVQPRLHEESVADATYHDYILQNGLEPIKKAVTIPGKQDRYQAIDRVKAYLKERLMKEDPAHIDDYMDAFQKVKSEEVRRLICEEEIRLDGRKKDEIRRITGEIDWIPSPHGSAIFTRGETQACVTCTLAPMKDALQLETIYGDQEHLFFLHYSFPPYSVGEVRPVRGPGRREIGHGNLAWQALLPVLPDADSFPYAIRVYSEITQSNGSSSMATVCGGTLSLMDAGVPISEPVAGIAMGLIAENENYHILTDILGDEDHLGDMDFKVAGTRNGITAIQMDNKIGNLPDQVLHKSIEAARSGINHILGEISKICSEVRDDVKPHAPRSDAFYIRQDKIKNIIGPGGSMIKQIQADTSTTIQVNKDGKVRIYAVNRDTARAARMKIEELSREPEVGACYRGKVRGIKNFGIFVEIFPGTEGFVHVSELDESHVHDPGTLVSPGETIPIKVLGVDEKGRIKLSRKAALNMPEIQFIN